MKDTMVITGGAGFIGSHLVDRFLQDGFPVVVVDNLITGHERNLAQHTDNRQCHFLQHDVCIPFEIPPAFLPIGAVLHLASPASPFDYLEHPIETLKVGSLGTLNALEFARQRKVRFLLASTSEVYGDPQMHPQKESYWGNVNPIGPRSVYDEAKRFAESLTMAYHRTYGLETRIVRIFNTYGPRMRLQDGRAVPAFISQALLHQDLTVFGDGSQTRSFCYVSDLVEGIVQLLRRGTHEPVNLGNPHEMSILDLAQAISRKVGQSAKIVYKPLPVDDPKVRCPDISRAKTLLGWEPRVSFEEGIGKTLQYFRDILPDAPNP